MILLNNDLTAATRFPDPDLVFPFGILLFIFLYPSGVLAPANEELSLAPENPIVSADQHNELDGGSEFFHLAPCFKFGIIRLFKAKSALLPIPIEAPLAS